MRAIGLFVLATVTPTLACLEAASPPSGLQLLAGRDVGRMAIVPGRDRPVVVFEVPRIDGDPERPVAQLWSVPFAGGPARKLVDRGAWPVDVDGHGAAYVVVDPVAPAGQSLPTWAPGSPVSLSRFDLDSGAVSWRVDQVSTFAHAADQVFVQVLDATGPKPVGYLVNAEGVRRALGVVAQPWVSPRGYVYFIDPLGVLKRVSGGNDEEALAMVGVASSFAVDSADLRVLVAKPDPRTLDKDWFVVDTQTRDAPRVPLPAQCRFLGFDPLSAGLLCYEVVQSESTPEPHAKLHFMRSDASSNSAFAIPQVELAHAMFEPASLAWAPDGASVAVARFGPAAYLVRAGAGLRAGLLGAVVSRARFSTDGNFVAYTTVVDGDTGDTTTLLARPTDDPDAMPRSLSAPGRNLEAFEVIDGAESIVFAASVSTRDWALYAARPATGATRRIARLLGARGSADGRHALFVAAGRRVLAITDWSSQDRVGALTLYELDTGIVREVARSVSDFVVAPACTTCGMLDAGASVVFVVRKRRPSEHDGLWAMTLP